MTSIKNEWMSFFRDVVPADAHPIQVQEMRRAFYAGWRAAQTAIEMAHDLPSKADTIEALAEFYHELEAFKNSVLKGNA